MSTDNINDKNVVKYSHMTIVMVINSRRNNINHEINLFKIL